MGNRILFAALACAATTALAGETPTVNPSFLWNGSTDTTGRVITGSPEATSGYWFNYNDANDNGTSRINFPPEFDMNTFDYGLMAESLGGIKATVVLGEGAEKPYVGFGFNIWKEDQKGVDITAWGGICVTYESTIGFGVELAVQNESEVTKYDNYKATAGKSAQQTTANFPWSKFRQGNWGIAIDQATALANIATIKLKFEGSAGTVGEFKIVKLGSNCQCDQTATECGSKAIRPSTTASSFKATLSGRVLEFAGTTVFDKATIVDLQGNVVKTASAVGMMDLSTLKAGMYMLRIEGQGINHSQKIVLK